MVFARPCLRALTLSHGPCAMALGPLLESREARLADGMTVIHLVLLQKPVADQQFDATPADLDRCDHDNTPGAALAEASCADGGCGFISHITNCYYDIITDKCPILRV